jgi:hypothetical protein
LLHLAWLVPLLLGALLTLQLLSGARAQLAWLATSECGLARLLRAHCLHERLPLVWSRGGCEVCGGGEGAEGHAR